jgi:hypothetical protein
VAGTQVGTRADTYEDDGIYEALTERLSGGKPNTRTNILEHKWTCTVTPGQSISFFVQAYQTPSSDGDHFTFAYSTDDATYYDMVVVSATIDEGEDQAFALPADLAGTVYVRVRDTDRTIGQRGLDTLFVDHLLIPTDVSPVMVRPAPPVLQQAIAGDQSVTLGWTPSSGATRYQVWRRTGTEPYAVISPASPEVTGLTYTDTGLANDTTYEYVVTAVNGFGESESSNALSATPQAPTVTEPPTNLTATGARKKITLSWTQSTTPGVTLNRIYRSSNGSNYSLLKQIAAAAAYSDPATTGTTYYYCVTAVSANGESAPSNYASATAK